MASSQNKPDKMNQQLKQTEDEFIKAERYRRAIAAKQLLDNTLVSELLDTMIKEHYEAFINLNEPTRKCPPSFERWIFALNE